jgi:hypothetical protein
MFDVTGCVLVRISWGWQTGRCCKKVPVLSSIGVIIFWSEISYTSTAGGSSGAGELAALQRHCEAMEQDREVLLRKYRGQQAVTAQLEAQLQALRK